MSLNDRQSRFVSEYLVDMSATKAAVRAGYSPKTAKSQASRLLTIVNVQSQIKSKQREVEVKLDLGRERIIRDLQEAIDVAREDKDANAMIAACAELNKMMGYYK